MQIKYSVSILLALMSGWAAAQIDMSKSPYGSYYFDGDDVVFEFDLRTYARSADKKPHDFDDLEIREVAVSGTFNNWSADGWVMQRLDEYRFRLRKRLQDFNDVPNWEFKFLINGVYWTPPDSALKKQGILGVYDLKNPDAPTPVHGDTGNVVFRLPGYPHARQVILTGTFNNWDEQAIRMKRTADGWEIHLTLAGGVHEYKFIADGQWLEDPANPEKRHNQYGTYNSVLYITKGVRFLLKGFDDAREVILAGSFNDWHEKALKMHRTEAGWRIDVPLVPGKHLYKFIVDGGWMTDPANRREETDLQGNVNSVIFVR